MIMKLKPFITNAPFLSPLKTSENHKVALGTNGLNCYQICITTLTIVKLSWNSNYNFPSFFNSKSLEFYKAKLLLWIYP